MLSPQKSCNEFSSFACHAPWSIFKTITASLLLLKVDMMAMNSTRYKLSQLYKTTYVG